MLVNFGVLSNYIKSEFSDNHSQINTYGSEFLDQLGTNMLVNKYPVLWIVPTGVSLSQNVQNIKIDVYCLDVIIKGRSNIITILSETQSILNDFYQFMLNDNSVMNIDILSDSSMSPLNNYLMDGDSGWKMSMDIELPTSTDCDIPWKN